MNQQIDNALGGYEERSAELGGGANWPERDASVSAQPAPDTLWSRAKAIANTEGWEPWLFQRVENGVLCTGAVCPKITRGKRKGLPNYRKHDPLTKKTVFVGDSA